MNDPYSHCAPIHKVAFGSYNRMLRQNSIVAALQGVQTKSLERYHYQEEIRADHDTLVEIRIPSEKCTLDCQGIGRTVIAAITLCRSKAGEETVWRTVIWIWTAGITILRWNALISCGTIGIITNVWIISYIDTSTGCARWSWTANNRVLI